MARVKVQNPMTGHEVEVEADSTLAKDWKQATAKTTKAAEQK